MRLRFSILFLSMLVVTTGWSQRKQKTDELLIGTYQYADNTRVKNLEPLAAYLQEQTGRVTTVKSFPTVQALVNALQQSQVDIAFINTFGYLMFQQADSTYEVSAALSLPRADDNKYKSVMVVNQRSPLLTLDDAVKQASETILCLVNPGSTSGNLVPRLKLASLQPGFPERFFLEVVYANTHRDAIARTLTDANVVSAMGSEEYYRLGADTVKLRKLWESAPIPLGPVLVKQSLPAALKKTIQQSLLELHARQPEVLEQVKAGWTEFKTATQFDVVPADYYAPLLQLSNNPDVSRIIIRKFAN